MVGKLDPAAEVIRRGAALALLAGACAFAPGARAEYPPELAERSPAELAREAFAAPYGRALAAETARILVASADARCLQQRGLTPAALEGRSHELLVRNGTRMLRAVDRLVDGRRMRAVFAAHAGDRAAGEFPRLREDPDVRRYIELNDRAKLARVAERIVETVDRHLVLARVGLAKRLSPLASGDEALLQLNPGEKAVAEVDELIKRSRSQRLQRWLELQQAIAVAFKESFDQDGMVKLGPRQLTPGAVDDFANLCVFQKR